MRDALQGGVRRKRGAIGVHVDIKLVDHFNAIMVFETGAREFVFVRRSGLERGLVDGISDQLLGTAGDEFCENFPSGLTDDTVTLPDDGDVQSGTVGQSPGPAFEYRNRGVVKAAEQAE